MVGIHKKHWILSVLTLVVLGASFANAGCPWSNNGFGNGGCFNGSRGKPAMPPFDRPFPLGQVSDAFWETQQTNAEAADFILYDYEFVGETATLNPMGRDHMTQIARRLPHVPFPIVIEMSEKTNDPEENSKLIQIDETRRANVVNWLQRFYADDPSMAPEQIANRVVIAPDFVYQVNSEQAVRDFQSATGPGRAGNSYNRGFGGRGFSGHSMGY